MWFVSGTKNKEAIADQFFREIIDPDHFPKDYVSFVKKVVVVTRGYPDIRVLELELCPVPAQVTSPPTSPGIPAYRPNNSINSPGTVAIDTDVSRKAKDNENFGTQEAFREESEDSAMSEDYETVYDAEKAAGPKSDIFLNTEETNGTDTLNHGEPDNVVNGGMRENGRPESPVEQEAMTEEDLAVIREHILLIMEDAFPMALKVEHIAEDARIGVDITRQFMEEFRDRSLAQQLGDGRWIRVSTIKRKAKKAKEKRPAASSLERPSCIQELAAKHDFQVVNQMPILPSREQPTIAVITLLFCEKQAVDAMMEEKTTYVRYKKEGSGENQVYTIGVIGAHRVVSTKLTRLGTGQGATVSAGNSITRLLGTFGKIEHVFLVGIGGSIPSYVDDSCHVRCGDVVISKPKSSTSPSYVYVKDVVDEKGSSRIQFTTQYWVPKDENALQIINDLSNSYGPQSMVNSDLEQNVQIGLIELGGQELSFSRPLTNTDLLHKMDEDGAWEEVPHPKPAPESHRQIFPDRSVVFFGTVGAGFDQLVQGKTDYRQDFAKFNNVLALDSGYQAVLESIDGNRKDSFWVIRGIADYTDGMSGSEWQPYASLVAAAALKLILMRLSASRI